MSFQTKSQPPADTVRTLRDRIRKRMLYELERYPDKEKLVRIVEILAVQSRREGVVNFRDIMKTLSKEVQEESDEAPHQLDMYFQGKLNAYAEVCDLIDDELGNL